MAPLKSVETFGCFIGCFEVARDLASAIRMAKLSQKALFDLFGMRLSLQEICFFTDCVEQSGRIHLYGQEIQRGLQWFEAQRYSGSELVAQALVLNKASLWAQSQSIRMHRASDVHNVVLWCFVEGQNL